MRSAFSPNLGVSSSQILRKTKNHEDLKVMLRFAFMFDLLVTS